MELGRAIKEGRTPTPFFLGNNFPDLRPLVNPGVSTAKAPAPVRISTPPPGEGSASSSSSGAQAPRGGFNAAFPFDGTGPSNLGELHAAVCAAGSNRYVPPVKAPPWFVPSPKNPAPAPVGTPRGLNPHHAQQQPPVASAAQAPPVVPGAPAAGAAPPAAPVPPPQHPFGIFLNQAQGPAPGPGLPESAQQAADPGGWFPERVATQGNVRVYAVFQPD